jgi:hypothetical protein
MGNVCLVHPITNSVFWDVTPYIVVALYEREGKKIQAARISEKLVSIYQMSLAFIQTDRNPVTASCSERDAIPKCSYSIYSDSPSTAVSSVRDLTTMCLRFGIPSRLQQARWARSDSVVRRDAHSRDKPNLKGSTDQNFVPSFVHNDRGFVCRKLCALTNERICKTLVLSISVKS